MSNKTMKMMKGVVMISFILMISTQADPFEYFKMSHQWGKGVCKGIQCSGQAPDKFTVHGLWPANFTTVLNNCMKQTYANQTDPLLLKKLMYSWPDLERPAQETTEFQVFWRHEWDGHGTCVAPSTSQRDYFELAMNTKNSLDLLNVLNASAITPGGVYPFTAIQAAVSGSINRKVPDILCNKTSCQLEEIRVCYDPRMTLIDCPLQQNVPGPRSFTIKRSSYCLNLCTQGVTFQN